MNTASPYTFRQRVLKKIYTLCPFNVQGELCANLPAGRADFISCLVCTARGTGAIKELLNDLAQQDLNKNRFEFIILDNSPQGIEALIQEYAVDLPLKYIRDTSTHGEIGALRNALLEQAQGDHILFLDDDTRILQKDFLHKALILFKSSQADIILPRGKPIAPRSRPDYKFLDAYSFATRCCLFRRKALQDVGGFHEDIIAYSDIDLGIRLSLMDKKTVATDELEYLHPSLYFESLKKPLVIGWSVLALRRYYPWHVWLLIYINALRFLPLILVPTTSNRQWFKISLGVLLAPFASKRSNYLT